jgi:APA family basic amino acid/polyamine antiporter
MLIAIGGLFYLNADHFSEFNLSGSSNLMAITATTTLTFFAFLGLECATIPSGDIRDSGPTVARATVLGTVVSTMVYMLGTVAVMGIIPPHELMSSQAPFSDAAASIWGEPARYLVAGGAVISTFGALNGWIVMQGQMPYAAARDRLLPSIFSKQNKKGVPAIGLVISSVLVSALMFMNFSEHLADTYKYMILLATLNVLPPYLFSAASYAILAAKGQKLTRQMWVRLVIALVASVFSILAIIGCGEVTVFWGFVLLMAGVPFYTWMKLKNA